MKYFNTAINETINNNAAITNEIPPTKRCAHCGRTSVLLFNNHRIYDKEICDLCIADYYACGQDMNHITQKRERINEKIFFDTILPSLSVGTEIPQDEVIVPIIAIDTFDRMCRTNRNTYLNMFTDDEKVFINHVKNIGFYQDDDISKGLISFTEKIFKYMPQLIYLHKIREKKI